MKYTYIILLLALIAGGFYLVTSGPDALNTHESTNNAPEGSHVMPDGSIMNNGAPMEDTEESMSQEESQEKMVDVDMSMGMNSADEIFAVTGANYEYSLSEIRVKKGDTVTINFESADGFHDWVVDEFSAATDRVQPGSQTSVTFVADKVGTFEYYCSVGSHRANGMVGKLIVE